MEGCVNVLSRFRSRGLGLRDGTMRSPLMERPLLAKPSSENQGTAH